MKHHTVSRGQRTEIVNETHTLYLDTKAPGTDLRHCPNDMRVRWHQDGWGHYTVARNDTPWGQPGKVAHNGAFMTLAALQRVVDDFARAARAASSRQKKVDS